MILEAYMGKTRTKVLAIVAFLILILEFFSQVTHLICLPFVFCFGGYELVI